MVKITSKRVNSTILGLALAGFLASNSFAKDAEKAKGIKEAKNKIQFNADYALRGFNCIDYNSDKDTKLQGYGLNPELNLLLSKKFAKGTISARLNNELEKYNGDMTSNGLKIANFNVLNSNHEILGEYNTPKGWIFGAGLNFKNRKAKVSLDDFKITSDHSENLKGIMYELGLNKPKYGLIVQMKKFEGESNDSIDQNGQIIASNKGYISDGSDTSLELRINSGSVIITPFIGSETYSSNGKIENNYVGVDLEGELSKNIRAVFGAKQIKTGDSNGYNNSQTQIRFGIKGRFGGYK